MKPSSQTQQATGPVVWVLSSGEDHEGGYIIGVYATKDAAKGPFLEAAEDMPFDVDDAWQDGDGAVSVHGGCDWVSLKPYPLVTQLAVKGGAR